MAWVVFPCRYIVQPKILNFSLKRNLWHPTVVQKIMSKFSSASFVLVHHRLSGLGAKSRQRASSIKARNICSTFSFERAKSCQPTQSCIFDVLFRLTSTWGQNLSGFFFLPQTRGFDAPLTQASLENETALHVFKHGFTFQPRHFT